MLNFYKNVISGGYLSKDLSDSEKFSIFYHDMFDYPLDFADLIRWRAGEETHYKKSLAVSSHNGYFFREGRQGLIYQKLLRGRISKKKIVVARKASKVISLVPTIKMIAVTGSLAMENSTEDGDIDLLIVTSKNTLWISRLLTYFLLSVFRYSLRRSKDRKQKDKLCLNMWLDESDLIFLHRNVYTAHEIAQVIPFFNKGKTYERVLWKNRWLLKYWPNSVKILSEKDIKLKVRKNLWSFLEKLAYNLQYKYMRSKITRETVTPTRALFHPQDWSKVVLDRLNSNFVE